MIVVIGVNVVVYEVCKCAKRFNPAPIHIKGVGFTKVLRVFCEIYVNGVQIDFVKVQGVSCESNIDIVPVDFTQI